MNSFLMSSDGQEHYKNLNCLCNTPTMRSITGKITNPSGEPIKNVTIKSVTPCLEPVSHTISNDEGEYSLIVPSFIAIKLIVSKNKYTTISTGIINSDIQNFTMVFQEKSACIVKGKLLFTNCKPANELRVRIISKDFEETRFSYNNGTFIFQNVPPGKYILIIDGNECYEKITSFTIDENKEFCHLPDIFLHWKNIGGTLHGMITDYEGKPVPNALVILYNQCTNTIVNYTRSNIDGIYFFGNLPTGAYYVEAYC